MSGEWTHYRSEAALKPMFLNVVHRREVLSVSYRDLPIAAINGPLIKPGTKILRPLQTGFSSGEVAETDAAPKKSVIDAKGAPLGEPMEKWHATVSFAPNAVVGKKTENSSARL